MLLLLTKDVDRLLLLVQSKPLRTLTAETTRNTGLLACSNTAWFGRSPQTTPVDAGFLFSLFSTLKMVSICVSETSVCLRSIYGFTIRKCRLCLKKKNFNIANIRGKRNEINIRIIRSEYADAMC
jgi:hypothetical protein